MSLIVPLIIAAIALSTIPIRAARKRVWARAAEALGLGFTEGGFFSSPRIEGQVGGTQVVVRTIRRGGKHKRTYTVIRVGARVPHDLVLRSEGLGSAINKLIAGRDLQIGDPMFDQRVLIRGEELETLALLDSPTRHKVKELLASGGWVADRVIRWEKLGHLRNEREITGQVQELLAVSGALAGDGRSVEERIARNALHDPEPGVRLRNLEALLAQRRGLPVTLGLARRCLEDPDPAIALTAALFLGDEALERIEALMAAPSLPPMLRIRALERLGQRGEPALLELLAQGSTPVKRAAARALGASGGLGAVEHLLPYTEGLLTDAALKTAAREAVAAIQARCGGGERGAISLSEADASGALSLAQPADRGTASPGAAEDG